MVFCRCLLVCYIHYGVYIMYPLSMIVSSVICCDTDGTSYPILWRVHGPTPHNWRCFGLDVARRCYLLIEYIILLAIALYWRLLSSSHHNHYRDSYSGALELQSWRLPIQIKPDYAHSDPIPFLCLDPHSIVLKSKWQSMAESISIHTKRPQQPRASHSTYHI
eukprot:87351_1